MGLASYDFRTEKPRELRRPLTISGACLLLRACIRNVSADRADESILWSEKQAGLSSSCLAQCGNSLPHNET